LLSSLANLRSSTMPIETVLRTNLAYPLSQVLIQRIAHSTDQVVVSVDGDLDNHNMRRGAGSYDNVVTNLRALVASNPSTKISLAAVLTTKQKSGCSWQGC